MLDQHALRYPGRTLYRVLTCKRCMCICILYVCTYIYTYAYSGSTYILPVVVLYISIDKGSIYPPFVEGTSMDKGFNLS